MQTEKDVALITGARTGVGLALTKRLLREGWDVVALVRSPFSSDADIDQALSNGRLRVYRADLADFDSLRLAVQDIAARESSIEVLFNNAGVNPESLELSPQGRELCFEVNTVVPYVLSQEVLPLLARGKRRRIVNTSSNILLTIKTFDPAQLERPSAYKKLFGPYARSKLALSLLTKAAADAFSAKGVSIVSACPGPNKTPLTAASGMPWVLKMAAKFLFKPPTVGAQRIYHAALENKRAPTGSFVIREQTHAIPFEKDATAVLARVDAIYRGEYLNASQTRTG